MYRGITGVTVGAQHDTIMVTTADQNLAHIFWLTNSRCKVINLKLLSSQSFIIISKLYSHVTYENSI